MTSASSAEPVFTVVPAEERAHVSAGWLDTYYSFSFADYYDPKNLHWGALRVFNDDTIAAGEGFPMHSHRDMEIVTYVLSGELTHRDSMGNEGVVGTGGVQFMSAGTGVRHSEYNGRRHEPLHLVQMWIVPGRIGTAPSYGEMAFDVGARRNRWLTVVSGEPDVAAPIRITQTAIFKVAQLDHGVVKHEFTAARYGFLFLASGAVMVNGAALKAGDAIKCYDQPSLEVGGDGEIVLWDLPAGTSSAALHHDAM